MVNILQEDFEYISSKIDFSILDNKKIMIIGASGFLGYNFVQNLQHSNAKFTAYLVDLNSEEKYCNTNLDNRFLLCNTDILNFGMWLPTVNYIVHLASNASPISYRCSPLTTANVNIKGLQNILDYYNNKDPPKIQSFLYFSTSEVYGDPTPDNIPTPETYKGNVATMGPRACYDESKRYAETLCYLYHKLYGMPIKIVRPFNNYGPGMHINDGRLPADMAKAIIKNEDITLYSNGTPSRTYCYVSDAMIGYWKALFYPKFDVFNIGNDYPELTVKEFATAFKNIGKKLFNYTGNIISKSSKDSEFLIDNPTRRCPDISKAMKLLGYKPTITISAGIEKYLTYLGGEL